MNSIATTLTGPKLADHVISQLVFQLLCCIIKIMRLQIPLLCALDIADDGCKLHGFERLALLSTALVCEEDSKVDHCFVLGKQPRPVFVQVSSPWPIVVLSRYSLHSGSTGRTARATAYQIATDNVLLQNVCISRHHKHPAVWSITPAVSTGHRGGISRNCWRGGHESVLNGR